MKLSEASVDVDKIWYLGNNRAKNLRLVQPSWDAPFFLTDNVEYARDYSDYGIYKVILKGEVAASILDFNDAADVSKLRWPEVLIEEIQTGKHDLNSLAYDLYELSRRNTDKLYSIQPTAEWKKAATMFAAKAMKRKSIASVRSHWADESDYAFLLEMWKDIHLAGFSGFTHVEFNSRIIALFSIAQIDKICLQKI